MTTLIEWQFDGLVGPTHHYGGLSSGNLASTNNQNQVSSPKAAALQGLKKMRFVKSLGIKQAFLPPHPRPNINLLKSVGFRGTPKDILARAYEEAPQLLSQAFSASAMWTANAATVTPSTDSKDGKLHLTPANLVSKVHRAQEAQFTEQLLRNIFHAKEHFHVHQPLFPHMHFGDEGAANHTRLFATDKAAHIFGYGFDDRDSSAPRPKKYVARQTRQASEALIRNGGIEALSILAHQDPIGIDTGSFHSDVLMVGTGQVLLMHEHSFLARRQLFEELKKRLGGTLEIHVASDDELPCADAVAAYPFNSQLLMCPDGSYVIIAPKTCLEVPSAHTWLEKIKSTSKHIKEVHYLDVKQSMKNGGGPACLRLRVPMTGEESQAIHQGVVLTDERAQQLQSWVERHYRDKLTLKDFCDASILDELKETFRALGDIIGLPELYMAT